MHVADRLAGHLDVEVPDIGVHFLRDGGICGPGPLYPQEGDIDCPNTAQLSCAVCGRTLSSGHLRNLTVVAPEEKVMSELTRRQFFKVTGYSLVSSSLAVMGFSPEPALADAMPEGRRPDRLHPQREPA